MQEWCSCGGSVKGWRKDVIRWRATNVCVNKPADEPEMSGSSAQVERTNERYYETSTAWSEKPIVQARMGFNPNA